DVRVVGGEAVAEGQREKNAEWRATLRLRVKQAGEEHRFCRRLAPPDCLAGTDQLGEIERFGRYGDRGFHAPLRAGISSAIGLPRTARPRGAERPNPGSRRAPRRGKVETRAASSTHLIRTTETAASCGKRICLLRVISIRRINGGLPSSPQVHRCP